MSTAVVYLLRVNKHERETYLFQFQRFIKSFNKFNDTVPEKNLYIILKGDDIEFMKEKIKIEKNLLFNIFECEDKSFDLGAYFHFHSSMKHLFSEYIFFNSHAEINGDNWYALLSNKVKSNEYALVGSTGCYASLKGPKYFKFNLYYALWFLYLRLRGLKFYSKMQKIFFDVQEYRNIIFKEFPSPHIRTTGFCINAKLFEKFITSVPFPSNKFHAHVLENSNIGLTNFVKSQNGKIAIVTKDGKYVQENNWNIDPIFNGKNNLNALILDNKLRLFSKKSKLKQNFISFSLWGN